MFVPSVIPPKQVATTWPPWASPRSSMNDGPLTAMCALAAVESSKKSITPNVVVIVASAAVDESQKKIPESDIPPPRSKAAEPADDESLNSNVLPPAPPKLVILPAVAEL